MAHANPEFALARQFMQATPVPVAQQRRELPTPRDMQRWIDRIMARHPNHRHGPDAEAADAYIAGARRIMLNALRDREAPSQLTSDRSPRPSVDRPKAGERFVEPKRRFPLDVQRDKSPGAW